ncbi:MAG: hypothetical protein DMG14_08620 [Acidobacteria bacterium]|nr:MAG: hypothetical protein DMG14_08620 [Acidobacteriota bacterium]
MRARRPGNKRRVTARDGANEERRTAVRERLIPVSIKRGFSRRNWLVVVFLIAVNLLAYAPVRNYGFVNYDDPQYITQNRQVTGGLTWPGVIWAFTTGYQANWHPLTWLSHMLDAQLYGLNAGAHHLTNLLLHIVNTLLLFWLLVQMTGALGSSTLVAALFAVHPLHVESVAWVAERKDVLSTLFWMLTIYAYLRYVRQPKWPRYLALVMFFALGLLAKPMLVTLPFVLLLLDFWPLRRVILEKRSKFLMLIREKIPLLILTAASSVVTLIAQEKGGAVAGMELSPMTTRIGNACIAYFTYVWQTAWPSRLAAHYPATPARPGWWVAAALALIAVSVLSIWAAPRRPYIAVGWFWYVGTLVPVIGLVKVGWQTMADRYTYVPLVGLFLIVAFGVPDALVSLRPRKFVFVATSGVAILACIWATRAQLQYWSGSRALWEHTLKVTSENAIGHFSLAVALDSEKNAGEAIYHYAEALRIEPRLAEAHASLGVHDLLQGKAAEAVSHFSEAIRLKPAYPLAHSNLGSALAYQGRLAEAVSEYTEAVRLDPDYADAHRSLGILLTKQGKTNEAIAQFSEALRINSDDRDARAWLANLNSKNAR